MITRLDDMLDRITMYRLVLYVLLGYVGIAIVLAAAGQLPFAPLALLVSTAFLLLACWAANRLLAWAFNAPTNVESSVITALILALLFQPAQSPSDVQYLGWAAVLAMGSKYILALHNKHIFNPAAVAAVITSVALGYSASWWVGTTSMLPVVLIGGALLVRKLRQGPMVASFIVAALVTVCAVSLLQGIALGRELQQLFVESPVFFAGSIMLTEPLTVPPRRDLKLVYGALVGILIVPQIHIGSLYSTPELALVVGTLFSYLVSSKRRVVLHLKRKSRVAPDILDFAFIPAQPGTLMRHAPGQYMEFTLAHPRPDSRGNRRYFTIASSPTEDVVHLGVRVSQRGSSFKRALAAMDGRSQLIAGQVAGDFTLPADPSRKLVFIAGGIGITPYRSMLKYLLDTRERRDIVVLYAARTAHDFAYADVLNEAQAKLGVRVVYTLTDLAAIPQNWPGARGRISAQMIQQAVPDYHERTFYLSGPPDMVRAHERVLRGLRVPHDHIKKDFFPGLVS